MPNSRTIVVCMMWLLCHCGQKTRHCHDPRVISVQKVTRLDLYAVTIQNSVVPHQGESNLYGDDSGRFKTWVTYPNFADNFPSDPEDQHDRVLASAILSNKGGCLELVLRRSNCTCPESWPTNTAAFSSSALLVEILVFGRPLPSCLTWSLPLSFSHW